MKFLVMILLSAATGPFFSVFPMYIHILYKQEYREKKLARLPFDIGVVNTTDDDCEQQVSSVALRLQQLTTRAQRRLSCRDYNSCGLTLSRNEGRINIAHILYLKPEYLPRGASRRGSECGNRNSGANFPS